jgi:heme-degrading monooxygenase HmoA
MHAVFVVSEIDATRKAEAEAMLQNAVAPQVKQAPGFVSATWARSADGNEGRSMAVFETEEAARALLAVIEAIPADAPVKVVTTSVLEVVLQL